MRVFGYPMMTHWLVCISLSVLGHAAWVMFEAKRLGQSDRYHRISGFLFTFNRVDMDLYHAVSSWVTSGESGIAVCLPRLYSRFFLHSTFCDVLDNVFALFNP